MLHTEAAWATRSEVEAIAETKRLALETIFICILGISNGPALKAFARGASPASRPFRCRFPVRLTRERKPLSIAYLGRFETVIAEHPETAR